MKKVLPVKVEKCANWDNIRKVTIAVERLVPFVQNALRKPMAKEVLVLGNKQECIVSMLKEENIQTDAIVVQFLQLNV